MKSKFLVFICVFCSLFSLTGMARNKDYTKIFDNPKRDALVAELNRLRELEREEVEPGYMARMEGMRQQFARSFLENPRERLLHGATPEDVLASGQTQSAPAETDSEAAKRIRETTVRTQAAEEAFRLPPSVFTPWGKRRHPLAAAPVPEGQEPYDTTTVWHPRNRIPSDYFRLNIIKSFNPGHELDYNWDKTSRNALRKFIYENSSSRDNIRKALRLRTLAAFYGNADPEWTRYYLNTLPEKLEAAGTSIDAEYERLGRELNAEALKDVETDYTEIFIFFAIIFFIIGAAMIFLFLWRRRARIARFFSRLASKGRFADLPAWRKYHIALSAVAFLLLALAAADLDAPYGFFVFLRIVACVSFLGFLACRLPFPLKFLSLLAAILYNPVAMVRFDDRDPWIVCNFLSLLLLAAIGFVQAWQSRKNP